MPIQFFVWYFEPSRDIIVCKITFLMLIHLTLVTVTSYPPLGHSQRPVMVLLLLLPPSIHSKVTFPCISLHLGRIHVLLYSTCRPNIQPLKRWIWLGYLLLLSLNVVILSVIMVSFSFLNYFRTSASLSKDSFQPCLAPSWSTPDGMPTCRKVSLVLPSCSPCSSNVTVTSISRGKSELIP
jgi:hypothetical protein